MVSRTSDATLLLQNEYVALRDYTDEMGGFERKFYMDTMSDLRDKDNFSKKTFFASKQNLKESMVMFTSEPIPRSLLKFTKADFKTAPEGLQKWNEIRDEGRNVFKKLLGYMGLSTEEGKREQCGKSIIETGIKEPFLRDEIYLQLIKQTTLNPDEDSCVLVLRLMFLCLRAFPPSRNQVIECLRTHLADRAVRVMTKFVGFSTQEGAAGHCWEALTCVLGGTPGFDQFSQEQVDAMVNLESLQISVQIDGGRANCEIPVIPDVLRDLFVYEQFTGQIRSDELVQEIARVAQLNFFGDLEVVEPTDSLKALLNKDVLPRDFLLCDAVKEMKGRPLTCNLLKSARGLSDVKQ